MEFIFNLDFYGVYLVIILFDIIIRFGLLWIKEGLYDVIIFSNDFFKVLVKNGFESGLYYEICNILYDGRFFGLL